MPYVIPCIALKPTLIIVTQAAPLSVGLLYVWVYISLEPHHVSHRAMSLRWAHANLSAGPPYLRSYINLELH